MSGKFTKVSSPVDNSKSATDWQRIKSLTDQDIDAAIAVDADAYAMVTTQLGHDAGRYHYNLACDADANWYWQLVARDGRVLAESAARYPTREAVQDSIKELRSALLGSALAA